MTEATSPTFRRGLSDGARDRAIVEGCPMGTPIGPHPSAPGYPNNMYLRGYNREWSQARPHGSCKNCDPRQREEERRRR